MKSNVIIDKLVRAEAQKHLGAIIVPDKLLEEYSNDVATNGDFVVQQISERNFSLKAHGKICVDCYLKDDNTMTLIRVDSGFKMQYLGIIKEGIRLIVDKAMNNFEDFTINSK